MAATRTVDEIAAERVAYKLAEQASAQREIAKILDRKAPNADALIAAHERTAHKYDLLHAAVLGGLLDRLEADHGA